MKLSVSNIAWTDEHDNEMYLFLQEEGIGGIEIAPTRIFLQNPYRQTKEITLFAKKLESQYHLKVSSMQSIWYGRTENLFASQAEREKLLSYTKLAIVFAQAAECKNLVFGCPKNRSYKEGSDLTIAADFFKELGDYAAKHKTTLAMEANPVIYGTNFCNTTQEAVSFVKSVDSSGFLLNLDIGTMLYYEESLDIVKENLNVIHHIHISEPNLEKIKRRAIHEELAALLKKNGYEGYVSLEMKTQQSIEDVKDCIRYIKEMFG